MYKKLKTRLREMKEKGVAICVCECEGNVQKWVMCRKKEDARQT
jgi:predicted peroxiredoxin